MARQRKEKEEEAAHTAVATFVKTVPPYGNRKGFIPRAPGDFGDGGAFPEIRVAQYPLNLGKPAGAGAAGKTSNALAVQLDAEGKVKYDVLARRGHGKDKVVYSKFTDLLPKELTDADESSLQRPDDDAVKEATEATRAALEKLVSSKITAAMPVRAAEKTAPAQYVRYTPAQQGAAFNSGAEQRVIRMVEAQRDPMSPPRQVPELQRPSLVR